ncbi:hypothetical protein [Streptomyces sp. NPDC002889]|uniref:hypothetical protein n=1 Tax=Streptomyces sp. NPDC002889 TaxID=3364669 RepID=UPI0036A14D9E
MVLPNTVRLRDGSAITVRLLSDNVRSRACLLTLLKGCTAEDRAARMGAWRDPREGVPWLLPREPQDIALAAQPVEAPDDIIAVVNLNVIDGQTRELAVLVANGWRRRGVATAVLTAAHLIAEPHIVVTGIINSTNLAARRLLRTIAPGTPLPYERGGLSFAYSGHRPSRQPAEATADGGHDMEAGTQR